MYQINFLVNRFIYAFTLIFLRDQPQFQVKIILWLNLLSLMYLLNVRPFYDKKKLKMQIFNKITIVICFNIILLFLDPSIESKARDFLGWSLISLAISNAIINMVVVSKISFSEGFDKAQIAL